MARIRPLFGLALAQALLMAAPGFAARRPFVAPTAFEVAVAQEKAQAQTNTVLAEKLRVVSDPFVGAPYLISPLGEASGPDPDPLMRFDGFDCTTFVETVLALALTQDLTTARRLLDRIRYHQGERDFMMRRHFPGAEWIPSLVDMGFARDITADLAGADLARAEKKLDAGVWRRRKKPTVLELPEARIPTGVVDLPIWPLDQARAGQLKIPPGTLLNLVRVNYGNVPVRVSHQGLVIEKGGKLYLRHAADRMYHSVVDEPLDRFFHRMQQYKKWPVAGIHLMHLQKPRRLAELLTEREPDPFCGAIISGATAHSGTPLSPISAATPDRICPATPPWRQPGF
jgi:hypothetical protein